MASDTETFQKELYDLLKVRGFHPIPLNRQNKRVPVPQIADVIEFTFNKDGKDYGKAWVTVDDAQNVILYYDEEQQDSPSEVTPGVQYDDTWTGFTTDLKKWAMRRQLGFERTNKDRLGDDMRQREHYKMKEKLGEGYYPMGKKASYNDAVPSVKIVIQHSRTIEEGEQRYRNVDKIFLENILGERILAPTTRPGIARVYARHIAEGGVPNDERWNHIKSICEEYNKMAGFVRATRGKQFNESAQSLVNEGINHYNNLRETLSRMTGHRGYNKYFESWTPTLMETEGDEQENLNELFVQETLDPRIESVMPILSRLRKTVAEMKEVDALSEWADGLLDEATDLKTIPEEVEQVDEALHHDVKKAVAAIKGAKHVAYEHQRGAHVHWFTGISPTAVKKHVAQFGKGAVEVEGNEDGETVVRVHKKGNAGAASRMGIDESGPGFTGSPGAPTAAALKASQNEEVEQVDENWFGPEKKTQKDHESEMPVGKEPRPNPEELRFSTSGDDPLERATQYANSAKNPLSHLSTDDWTTLLKFGVIVSEEEDPAAAAAAASGKANAQLSTGMSDGQSKSNGMISKMKSRVGVKENFINMAPQAVAEESIDHEEIYGINLEPFIDYVKRKSGKLGAAEAMDNVKYSLEVYHNKQGEELNKILNAVKMAASGLGEADESHTDEENSMASDNLNKMAKASTKINKKVKGMGNKGSLQPWQQQLVATAADKVDAVYHSMDAEHMDDDDIEEGLDANQKRVGQLGPTEPVGKNEKNLRGKLVGCESVDPELALIKKLSGI